LLVGPIVDDYLKAWRYGERFPGEGRAVFCAQLVGIDLAE
jgi:hypothetical protein